MNTMTIVCIKSTQLISRPSHSINAFCSESERCIASVRAILLCGAVWTFLGRALLLQDKDGSTAIDVAMQHNFTTAVSLLTREYSLIEV
eukprot:3475932-Amphidinium_carterae.1